MYWVRRLVKSMYHTCTQGLELKSIINNSPHGDASRTAPAPDDLIYVAHVPEGIDAADYIHTVLANAREFGQLDGSSGRPAYGLADHQQSGHIHSGSRAAKPSLLLLLPSMLLLCRREACGAGRVPVHAPELVTGAHSHLLVMAASPPRRLHHLLPTLCCHFCCFAVPECTHGSQERQVSITVSRW